MNEAPLNLYKIQMEVMTLSRVEIEVETTLSEEEVLFKLQDHPNTLLTPECGVSTHNGKINGAEVWCDMLNEGPTYITSCAVRAIHKETKQKEEPPQMETPDYKKIILALAEELKIEPEILYYNEPDNQLILDRIVFPDEITGGDEYALFTDHLNTMYPSFTMFDILFEPAHILYTSNRSVYDRQFSKWCREQHATGAWIEIDWDDPNKGTATYRTQDLVDWIVRAKLARERRYISCNP